MQHRDGDTIRDVEARSADAVGIDSPFTDRGRFPAHAIKQQLRRDVLNIAGRYVDLKPRQFVRGDSVVVRVKEFRSEVNREIRGHLNEGTR